MDKKLKVEFLGMNLESPLVLTSGIMGLSYSSLLRMAKNTAGIITTKSLTLVPRKGHKGPVIAEFNGGILNSMGLCNPGIEDGLKEVSEFKRYSSKPVIVSIFGNSIEEFEKLTEYVNHSEGDFIELNLSCPNVFDEFGLPISASKDKVYQIVKSVKSISKLPVIAKLSPNVYNIKEIAISCENAGADAICLINTVGTGMLIDIKMVKPILHNKFGGISGPCVKPIAIKLVYEAHQCVDIPIIGVGGVLTGEDAVEMLITGANLVGIGSGIYYRGVEIFEKINDEILQVLTENKYEDVSSLPYLK
ncbi:MAG: dihydroorotate dehydrogenase [Candidatus Cloacimonadota bacterium]|nr:MAG: dihydroorotate dehydrogenase [Candidatus Cloacimonadota bacterium]